MKRSKAEQLKELLAEVESLRDALKRRRASSPYPWDPAPVADYDRLRERATHLLSSPPVLLPETREPSAGQRLWHTPTDEAIAALESLRAAITTALESV